MANRPATAMLRRLRGGRKIPALLVENPTFRRFWIGETISQLGDQITLIALPLAAVLVLHAGPAQMGYLVAAGWAPNLLFSLHAGAWLDRHGHRRRAMLIADLGRALLLGTIPLAYALDSLTLGQLYVVAFLTGTLSAIFYVAYSTLFVAIVPRERYVAANSMLSGSRALSFVVGPSLGGVLVQLLKAPFALVVDSASFLASAAFLRSISPAEPPTEEATRGHVVAGVRFIRDSPVVRASLAATATINFFTFVFYALFILFATDSLGVRPGTLGAILGAGALGGVIGSAITGRLGRRIGIGPAFLLGCVLFPAPLVLVPLGRGPPAARAGDAVRGRVRLGPGRDDPRHQRGRDLRGGDPGPDACTGLGGLHAGQLRRAAGGIPGRRSAGQLDRPAADPVDRRHRRHRRLPVAAALPAPAPAHAAGGS